MTNEELAAMAERLNAGQRRYLEAVASSAEPYEPRHGRTANWALRHNLTHTMVKLNDGREGPWDSWPVEERAGVGIAEIFGQRLTPLGQQVRAYFLSQEAGEGL